MSTEQERGVVALVFGSLLIINPLITPPFFPTMAKMVSITNSNLYMVYLIAVQQHRTNNKTDPFFPLKLNLWPNNNGCYHSPIHHTLTFFPRQTTTMMMAMVCELKSLIGLMLLVC